MKKVRIKRVIFDKASGLWLNHTKTYNVINDYSSEKYVVIDYNGFNVVVNKNEIEEVYE